MSYRERSGGLLRGAGGGEIIFDAGDFGLRALAEGTFRKLIDPSFGGVPLFDGPVVENGNGGFGLCGAGREILDDEVGGFARVVLGNREGDAREEGVAGIGRRLC